MSAGNDSMVCMIATVDGVYTKEVILLKSKQKFPIC